MIADRSAPPPPVAVPLLTGLGHAGSGWAWPRWRWVAVVWASMLAPVLVMVGCSWRSSAPTVELTFLVAASASTAVEQLARQFEAEHPGVRVRVSAGASNALAQQIVSGAPADLFLSANRQWAELVQRSRPVSTSMRLLTNRLVIVVPRGNPAGIRSLNDLTSPGVSHVAVAAESVPAGMYAEQALESAGVLATLRDGGRLVRGGDVRTTLVHVERGEAEAGIVYATDARDSQLVEVVGEIDPATHEAIVYSLVVLDGGEAGEWVGRFHNWLLSAEGARVFEQAGFTVLRHER